MIVSHAYTKAGGDGDGVGGGVGRDIGLWFHTKDFGCTDVLCAVSHDIAFFFCADYHSICHCSVYESVGEVLKFNTAAAHKIDAVGKS